MPERVLVLAVDIDNDLYRKAGVHGPVIGKDKNLEAAAKLAAADPTETDANVMFEAVRKHDELRKLGYSVAVATVTGAEDEGYAADSEMAHQLDIVIDRFKADACVLVTDGASDQRILPILKSRIKVNSVDIVRMRQAAEFESAYFTIIEKLREPHYARIVFGIPAALLLLFAVSYYLHAGWELPLALVGVYLVLYGFGLWESLVKSFRGFGLSIDRLGFVFYVIALLFTIIGAIIGYGAYQSALSASTPALVPIALGIESFLLLFTMGLSAYLAGRVMDLEARRMRYRAINQGVYIGYAIISIALLYLVMAWFADQIYFWQLLLYSLIALLLGYGVSKFSFALKRHAIRRARMKHRQVVTEIGAYIGRVANVDARQGVMLIKTNYGSIIRYDVDRITSIADRIVVR